MKNVKEHICKLLEEATGEKISLYDIEPSPLSDYGSSIAFKLAKKQKKNPKEIADNIAKKMKPSGFIEKVDAVNGYINFHLNYTKLTEYLLKDTKEKKLKKKKIVLEHTSVNPSGPIHVGRLRNTIIGDSLRRILIFYGYDVETHYYVNDIGKQVAMISTALNTDVMMYRDSDHTKLRKKYERYEGKDDFEIFFEYVLANKLFESDEKFRENVQNLIKDVESGNPESLKEIKKAADTCLKGQKETFKRLGIEFDFFDFESDDLKKGKVKKVLEKLKSYGGWKTKDVGSGFDLSKFGLERRGGITILERPDGTSVYLTRDIAYHLEKLNRGDWLINILGEDHKFEFQELKTILEKIYKIKGQLDVVHFSFVNFEGTKLSTRKGEIAPVDELLDEAIEKAENEVKKRGIATIDVAEMIGIGAIKFHLVKTSPTKQITFKWKDALSFEGETGPYVQYAHARSCRILEKSGIGIDAIKPGSVSLELENDEEKELVRTLAEFPEAVENAVKGLRPDIIASYLIRLTSAYGGFYMTCPVLESSEKVRNRRLLLVNRTRDAIKTGLGLLGIEAPERM